MLAVLLVIVAAVAAWYLIRFEFNRDYQAYIEAPKGAAAQSELAALTDETRMSPRLSSCLRKTTT